ncbi:hypothetical protein AgCh_000157 [Apium graveolens]
MGDALRVWEEMGMKGLERDLVAYNTIIGGFFKVGELKRVEEFFGKMELNGVDSSCVTYEHLNTVSEKLEYLMVAVKKLDSVPKNTVMSFASNVLCSYFTSQKRTLYLSIQTHLIDAPNVSFGFTKVCAKLPRVIEDQPWPGKMLLAYKRSDPVKLFQCDGCEVLCSGISYSDGFTLLLIAMALPRYLIAMALRCFFILDGFTNSITFLKVIHIGLIVMHAIGVIIHLGTHVKSADSIYVQKVLGRQEHTNTDGILTPWT